MIFRSSHQLNKPLWIAYDTCNSIEENRSCSVLLYFQCKFGSVMFARIKTISSVLHWWVDEGLRFMQYKEIKNLSYLDNFSQVHVFQIPFQFMYIDSKYNVYLFSNTITNQNIS